MRRCRPEPLLIALAVVVGRVACVSVDTPAVLSISPGACAGIEVDGLSARFSYESQFNSISEATCSDRIRISKFYVQEACVRDRNNQISLDSVKDLTCTRTDNNDKPTCDFVMNEGPEDAKITVSTLTQGQTFDQGPVCANENTGYIFVQSNCTKMADVSITFQQSTYDGPVCLNVGGHHLNSWAIAVIVIAGTVVLLIAFWMVCSCCCGSQYCCSY